MHISKILKSEEILTFASAIQSIYTRERNRSLILAVAQAAVRHHLTQADLPKLLAVVMGELVRNPLGVDHLIGRIAYDDPRLMQQFMPRYNPPVSHSPLRVKATEDIPQAVLDRRARKAEFRRKQCGQQS